ncbi:MAG TPA: carboxymuconolactone decarboxylase family protein [Dehalococcoidia bacterium]
MIERDDAVAWVNLPSAAELEASAPPGTRGGYDFGFVTNMGRLLRAHPRFGQPFLALFGQVMFAPGALSRREREMVAAVAAGAQDCTY